MHGIRDAEQDARRGAGRSRAARRPRVAGSDAAKVSTTQPSAPPSSTAPSRSARRRSGQAPRPPAARAARRNTAATRPIGVARREVASPNGTNGSPRETLVTRASGAARASHPATAASTASTTTSGRGRGSRPPPVTTTAPASSTPSTALIQKIARHCGDDEHEGAEHRPEHRAELLHGPDHPERHPAAVGRPELGDDREGRGHEAAATDALHDPAGDEHRQVGGQGRDRRADDEHAEAGEQHPLPVDEVGDPADERQHGDVAEQEAGDDRGRALECVDADADPAHHVGEGEHDDVGVGGGEGDGDRGRREERPRGG